MIALVGVVGGLLIGLVAVAGGIWSDVRKREIAAGLKHDMLDRGMSAEEIRTVLDSGTKRSGRSAEESRATCSE